MLAPPAEMFRSVTGTAGCRSLSRSRAATFTGSRGDRRGARVRLVVTEPTSLRMGETNEKLLLTFGQDFPLAHETGAAEKSLRAGITFERVPGTGQAAASQEGKQPKGPLHVKRLKRYY